MQCPPLASYHHAERSVDYRSGDIATKSGAVEIGFLDRFTGAVKATGDVSAVEMVPQAGNAHAGRNDACSSPPARSPGRNVMKRLMLYRPSQCGKTSLPKPARRSVFTL